MFYSFFIHIWRSLSSDIYSVFVYILLIQIGSSLRAGNFVNFVHCYILNALDIVGAWWIYWRNETHLKNYLRISIVPAWLSTLIELIMTLNLRQHCLFSFTVASLLSTQYTKFWHTLFSDSFSICFIKVKNFQSKSDITHL